MGEQGTEPVRARAFEPGYWRLLKSQDITVGTQEELVTLSIPVGEVAVALEYAEVQKLAEALNVAMGRIRVERARAR